MATAISYKSESGDDYLSLFDDYESIRGIVYEEKASFSEEFQYLHIIECKSTTLDADEVRKALSSAIIDSR